MDEVFTAANADAKAHKEAPKIGAKQMMEQYGAPNEGTPTKLFWYHNGPWKRTIVTSDVVVHNFTQVHSDFLTQFINYKVPLGKFDEVSRFDGSCLLDRTAGKVGARCDTESANVLTMNIMDKIVVGELSSDEARKEFAEIASAYTLGGPAPLAERIQFDARPAGTADPDESIIAGPMAKQMLGKAKDVVTGQNKPT